MSRIRTRFVLWPKMKKISLDNKKKENRGAIWKVQKFKENQEFLEKF